MQVFIELWSYKPAWTSLSPEERAAYMERVQPDIGAVLEAGVQVMACGSAADVDRAGDWDLFAVWSAPDEQTLRLLQEKVAASGWYDYFEQVNVAGEAVPLEELIGSMVAGS
jgi:hypothetical protein